MSRTDAQIAAERAVHAITCNIDELRELFRKYPDVVSIHDIRGLRRDLRHLQEDIVHISSIRTAAE